MKPQPFKYRQALAAVAFGALLLGALAVGDTSARYTGLVQLEDASARVAAFDVEIQAPVGVYSSTLLAGGRNEVEQQNVDSTLHEYRLVNHGEVAVRVTAEMPGTAVDAYTIDTPVFVLQPGEEYLLQVVLEGGVAGLQTTEQDMDLVFTMEQLD